MKVSVILTSYNHEKYIKESINSILNQTFVDFELIIIDDHSTDSSWDIIKSYKDTRIVAIQNEKNIRSKGFHNAIRRAKGQYIAIHHSDDIWELNKLEKQVKFLDENYRYAACFTRVDFIDESSCFYELPEGHVYKNIFDEPNKTREEWLRYFFYYGNCLCHPSILIRKEMYEKCKMLDMYGLAQLPDFYKWVKLCLYEDIFILPEKLVKFRINRSNNVNTSSDKPDVHIRSQIELYYILKEYRNISDIFEFLRIFPSAELYYVKNGMNLDFSLAKMCLNTESQPHKLLGITILFELINNHESSIEIENMYGYTQNDLIRDTSENDIFAISRVFNFVKSSIYLDFGNGFNEKDKVMNIVYISRSGDFYIKYDLSDIKNGRQIKNIRFDIDEGKFWKCSLREVNIDGKPANSKALNSKFIENNYNVFLTKDPIYIIDNKFKEISTIEVKGNIQGITDFDINNYISYEINKNEIIIQKKEKEIENIIQAMLVQEKEIENLKQVILVQEKEIENLKQVILVQEKELNNKNLDIQNKNKDIDNISRLVSEKKEEIEKINKQLEIKSNFIEEIEKSKAWKLFQKVNKLMKNFNFLN